MEGMPEKLQANIRKMSTLFLQSNLLKAGVDEKTILAINRDQLMVAWAQLVADGKDKPVSEAAARSGGAEASETRMFGYIWN